MDSFLKGDLGNRIVEEGGIWGELVAVAVDNAPVGVVVLGYCTARRKVKSPWRNQRKWAADQSGEPIIRPARISDSNQIRHL